MEEKVLVQSRRKMCKGRFGIHQIVPSKLNTPQT